MPDRLNLVLLFVVLLLNAAHYFRHVAAFTTSIVVPKTAFSDSIRDIRLTKKKHIETLTPSENFFKTTKHEQQIEFYKTSSIFPLYAFKFLEQQTSSSSPESKSNSTNNDGKRRNGMFFRVREKPESSFSTIIEQPESSFPLSSSETETTASITRANSGSTAPGSKLRRLRDTMWVRETLEDLTAAEFACSVEAGTTITTAGTAAVTAITTTAPSKKRRRKRAVDYEKLLNQLDRRIRDMGCFFDENNDIVSSLIPGVGMGSLTYTESQRVALLERTTRTRQALIDIIKSFELNDNGHEADTNAVTTSIGTSVEKKILTKNIPSFLTSPTSKDRVAKEFTTNSVPITGSSSVSESNVTGPKLYVREDGTVDWDGALQDQAALRKFGKAVWARINGRDSPDVDENGGIDENLPSSATSTGIAPKAVTAKIEDTPEIQSARTKLDELNCMLRDLERDHVRLLNSALLEGQATANVRLASLEPELRRSIRQSADDIKLMKERVSFQTLVYELERIYTYLKGEIGNPTVNGYVPLQDRLNVAELGLLESQIDSLRAQASDDSSSTFLDEDLLMVVYDQVTDFKRRLGIDYYVASTVSFDQETIRRWVGELFEKTKKGFAFYVKGMQLFWNDLVFCMALINRAATQGYTLKPREVRTLRYVSILFLCHRFLVFVLF